MYDNDPLPVAKLLASVGGPRPDWASSKLPRRPAWCQRCRAPIAPPPAIQYCDRCLPAAVRDRRDQRLDLARSTIPGAAKWARFDNPELAQRVRPADAVGQAREAMRSRRVLLRGKAGSGKTSLAAALFRAHLLRALQASATEPEVRAAESARFVPAYDLARAVQQTALGHGEPELVRACLTAGLLVLDDLGAEPVVPSSPVADVLYHRHAEGRRTIVTTGYSEAQLGARYGDGIVRRLLEQAAVISLEGAS